MKKLFTLILFLFVTGACFSQLSVKPAQTLENYIYVKGQVFYVEGSIDLQKNIGTRDAEASIYLREGAQLIQGGIGFSENSGNGVLSVFQEGTSNAYDYNYWAAPVGDERNGNGWFGIDMIYAPETEIRSSKSGSINSLDGFSSPLLISRRWIYTFSGKEYSDWQHIGNETGIPPGYGFTMKGVNGTDPTVVNGRENNPGNKQRYDFRGKPNTGRINIPITSGNYVLVGNPYPSALDLSLFLFESSGTGSFSSPCYGTIQRKNATTGIAYFWDSVENGDSHYLNQYVGGYGAFSPVDPCTAGVYVKPVFRKYGTATGVPEDFEAPDHYERRYSPIAQGFMVQGAANSTVDFKNSHRIFRKEGENSSFKRPSPEAPGAPAPKGPTELVVLPKIDLEVTINDYYVRYLSLVFWPTATANTDFGMDAKAYSLASTDMGFLQNEGNYVIDVRPFDENEEIQLFLRVQEKAALLDIKIVDFENLDSRGIFILDSEKQLYYPISENPVQLELESGTYHGRFKIAFRDKNQKPIEENPQESGVVIFQNNQEQQLQIWNSNLYAINSVALYDLTGKQVLLKKVLGSSEFVNFETGHLSNSVYLVKVFKQDGTVLTGKVTVANSN